MSNSFMLRANQTVDILKKPAMSGGIIGDGYEDYLSDLPVSYPEPVSSEVQQSAGLEAPFALKMIYAFRADSDDPVEKGKHFIQFSDESVHAIKYVDRNPSRGPDFAFVDVIVYEIKPA